MATKTISVHRLTAVINTLGINGAKATLMEVLTSNGFPKSEYENLSLGNMVAYANKKGVLIDDKNPTAKPDTPNCNGEEGEGCEGGEGEGEGGCSDAESSGDDEEENSEGSGGNEENGEENGGEDKPSTSQEQEQEQKPKRKRRTRKEMEEARKQEEEQRKQDEESSDDKQEAEAQELEEEARRMEEEARRMAEEARRKQEEAQKKLDELKRKKEEEARRKREEEEKKRRELEGSKHYKTDELIETLKTLGLAYLVGHAGTGKTTLAMHACASLYGITNEEVKTSEKFAQISFSPDTLSSDMLGFVDVNGVYHETDIVKVFREGGLILFDEMDSADASILVKLNTAIANGVLPTPNGNVIRHKDTYIVCTANTFGTGATSQYVGRTRLDAATLDRFTLATIEVGYDEKLEYAIARKYLTSEDAKKLMKATKAVRKSINNNNFLRVCSTRFVLNAVRWISNGKDLKWCLDKLMCGWTENETTCTYHELQGDNN